VTGFYNRRYDLVTSSTLVLTQPDGTLKPQYYDNQGSAAPTAWR